MVSLIPSKLNSTENVSEFVKNQTENAKTWFNQTQNQNTENTNTQNTGNTNPFNPWMKNQNPFMDNWTAQTKNMMNMFNANNNPMSAWMNMGNNNRLIESEVVSIFEAIKDQPQIIVVNTAVPRGWKDENNSLIQKIAYQYQNVKIVDWSSISQGHPEYFAPDGVHLVPTGINVYVDAILSELK
jgi:hypothetical protein